MAASATEKRLLLAGEWIETGEWIEVRSPYSGRARRARAEGRRGRGAASRRCRGAGDARATAGAQAGGDPRPRRRLPRPSARGGRADDLGGGRQAAEGGARRGFPRNVDLHDERRPGADARRRDGADGRLASGRRQARVHAAAADRRRRCDQPVQLPAQPGGAQARAGACRGLRGRPEACLADAALGAPARRARDGSRAPAGLAERARRTGLGARRRARRGRAGARAHVHGLGCGRLEARGAGAAQARQPRARQRDAGHRGGGCRPRGRRDQAGRERLLVRRPELHLGAADLRAAGGLRRAARAVPAQGRGAQGRRSSRRGD